VSSKDLQKLTVTTESSSTTTGGIVNAVVTITGDPDDKVRGATARLVRTALRKTTETNVFWGRGYHDEILPYDVVVAEAPLTDSSGKLAPGNHVVSFAVPDDALPSAPEIVSWSVKAVIERHHGIDVKADAPVEVLVGPERFAGEASSEAGYAGERLLELELQTRSLRPGDVIRGKILVRPTRALTLTRLTAGIARIVGTDSKGVVTQRVLDEQTDVQAGDTRDYPFELTMPGDAPPTVLGSATTPPCASHIAWATTAVAHLLRAPGEYGDNPSVAFRVNVYNTGMNPIDGGD
jgi:hypothetical protein